MSKDRKRGRIFAITAILVAVGAVAYLAAGNIGKNLVYYWSPSELAEAGDDAVGASIRLGGVVMPGSVDRAQDGLTLTFEVTDGTQTVPVYAEAVPPAMFREGMGVVVEGTMRGDGTFETRRLMVKHDNEYRPPEGEEAMDMKKVMETMQIEAGET